MIRIIAPIVSTRFYLHDITKAEYDYGRSMGHILEPPKNSLKLKIIKEGRTRTLLKKNCQWKRSRIKPKLVIIWSRKHKLEVLLPKNIVLHIYSVRKNLKFLLQQIKELQFQVYFDPTTSDLERFTRFLRNSNFHLLRRLKIQYHKSKGCVIIPPDLTKVLPQIIKATSKLHLLSHFSLSICPRMHYLQAISVQNIFSNLNVAEKVLEIFTPEIGPGFQQNATEVQFRQISQEQFNEWESYMDCAILLEHSVMHFDLWKPAFELRKRNLLKIYLIGDFKLNLSTIFSSRECFEEFNLVIPCQDVSFAPLPFQVKKLILHVIIGEIHSSTQIEIIHKFIHQAFFLHSVDIFLHNYEFEEKGDKTETNLAMFIKFILNLKSKVPLRIHYQEGKKYYDHRI